MTGTVVHSTFRIDRSYPHPVSRVFAAFRDPVTKRRWFDGPVPAAGQPADREHGCRELYEALARELDRPSREES